MSGTNIHIFKASGVIFYDLEKNETAFFIVSQVEMQFTNALSIA